MPSGGWRGSTSVPKAADDLQPVAGPDLALEQCRSSDGCLVAAADPASGGIARPALFSSGRPRTPLRRLGISFIGTSSLQMGGRFRPALGKEYARLIGQFVDRRHRRNNMVTFRAFGLTPRPPARYGIPRGRETAQRVKYPGVPGRARRKSNRATVVFFIHVMRGDFTTTFRRFPESYAAQIEMVIGRKTTRYRGAPWRQRPDAPAGLQTRKDVAGRASARSTARFGPPTVRAVRDRRCQGSSRARSWPQAPQRAALRLRGGTPHARR